MSHLASVLHRLDLTKDQRDAHIRRYTELLETRIVTQNAQQSENRPVGRPKSVITQVSEATGLSRDTIARALNPKPAPEPKAPLPDYDVVTVQYNALIAAWNRAIATRISGLNPFNSLCSLYYFHRSNT